MTSQRTALRTTAKRTTAKQSKSSLLTGSSNPDDAELIQRSADPSGLRDGVTAVGVDHQLHTGRTINFVAGLVNSRKAPVGTGTADAGGGHQGRNEGAIGHPGSQRRSGRPATPDRNCRRPLAGTFRTGRRAGASR